MKSLILVNDIYTSMLLIKGIILFNNILKKSYKKRFSNFIFWIIIFLIQIIIHNKKSIYTIKIYENYL